MNHLRFSDNSTTWYEANEFCQTLNGQLVEIGGREENEAIAGAIREEGHSTKEIHFWMGLRDRGSGLHWRVADHWRLESSGKKARYENWGREQPANNEEHCAFIWASGGLGKAWQPWGVTEIGKWHDEDCNATYFEFPEPIYTKFSMQALCRYSRLNFQFCF